VRVIVVLEGRDGAGKTTTARDLALTLGPDTCRIVSVGAPREPSEARGFYHERWLSNLAGPGSVVVFDRSWYNRALVERVMGFCTPAELEAFFVETPRVEEELIRAGNAVVKVFFEISREEQIRRLEERRVRGELSAVDAEAIARGEAYAKAEAEMFARTSTDVAPWIVLPECDRTVRCSAVLEQVRAAEKLLLTG
jgi:polyphosphate kinase 2 (PPK2 family)